MNLNLVMFKHNGFSSPLKGEGEGRKDSEVLSLVFKALYEFFLLYLFDLVSTALLFCIFHYSSHQFLCYPSNISKHIPPLGLCIRYSFPSSSSYWHGSFSPQSSLSLNFIRKSFLTHLIQNNSHIKQHHKSTKSSSVKDYF